MSKTVDLEEFRSKKDYFFAHDPHSPLTPEQKASFTGLKYFPDNPELRFELELQKNDESDEIDMQTSTGDVQTYQRAGTINFQVEGQEVHLTIYLNEYGCFLPFVDALAVVETYPAGRYLEPELLPDGKVLVDFNLAYNPYCAYNELWSCPLTPYENRLKVSIRAGEKNFKEAI